MAVLKAEVVAKNSGAAFELKKGQRLRITGRSVVDFVAFSLNDVTERFDQARTKSNQAKMFIRSETNVSRILCAASIEPITQWRMCHVQA